MKAMKIILTTLTGYVCGCMVSAFGVCCFFDNIDLSHFFTATKYLIFDVPGDLFHYGGVIEFIILGVSIITSLILIYVGMKKEKARLIPTSIFLTAMIFSMLGAFSSAKFEYVRRQAREGWDDKSKITIIKTPEIIRLLEEESISYVSTAHSQQIQIQLKDGIRYEGQYVQDEAGRYSTQEHFFDVYNLVMYIKRQRPESETKFWLMKCP